MDFDNIDEPVVCSSIGRKNKRKPETYSRNIAKRARHSGVGKVPAIGCKHNNDVTECKANSLSHNDLLYAHSCLYSDCDKVKQDALLLSYMDIQKVKRRREKVKDENKQKSREISVKYFLMREDKEKIPVCKASFMSIFSVKKDRLSSIAKFWFENGVAMPEKRGGARHVEENAAKKKHVVNHIETFMCRASHYARRGCPGRKYLPSDMSVKKMHDLFKEQNQEQISYAFYYSIFMYDFNLGIGHPSKDICSTCVKFRLKIKDPELTDDEKRTESALYLLHRRRGRKFYELLNSVDDSYTVCFDVMENLVLPKSAIGQTYYSRQLYMYVFGVVRHRGRNLSQGKEDIQLFVWTEDQNKKDSNMIASAMNYYFRSIVDLSPFRSLRLFSDSCFGQNKNINMVSMLCALHKQVYPNVRIEYTFPIRGHSFLPADRAFGRIEQDIRKHETILLPSEYIEILQRHGNVLVYGTDWTACDFKKAVLEHCTSQRSFKISEARVLEINSDKVGFKTTYSADFCHHSILKRGKSWDSYHPEALKMISCVKPVKKTDVLKLIGELGVNNTVQTYYNSILTTDNVGVQDLEESDNEN